TPLRQRWPSQLPPPQGARRIWLRPDSSGSREVCRGRASALRLRYIIGGCQKWCARWQAWDSFRSVAVSRTDRGIRVSGVSGPSRRSRSASLLMRKNGLDDGPFFFAARGAHVWPTTGSVHRVVDGGLDAMADSE